jgi:hypothetical protein
MDAYRVALSATSGATMEGSDLAVPRGIELPRLCAKCGVTKKLVRVAQPFDSVPLPVYVAFFLASPVLFGILYLALRRQATVTLSLCKTCERKTLDAKALRRLVFVGGIALFIGVLTAAFNGAPITAAVLSVAGALVAIPVMRHARRRDLWATYIGARHLVLRGVHPAAAQATIEATTPVT